MAFNNSEFFVTGSGASLDGNPTSSSISGYVNLLPLDNTWLGNYNRFVSGIRIGDDIGFSSIVKGTTGMELVDSAGVKAITIKDAGGVDIIGALSTNNNFSALGIVTANGGNSTEWNTAYDHKINSASFSGGTLTLTRQDASTVTVVLDGRYELLSNKGIANGYAPLDSGAKIPQSYLPQIAIVETFVVASEATQLALVAQQGDVAVRTDLNKSFILQGTDPSLIGDWQELLSPTDLVQSVNGLQGTVTLNLAFNSGTGDLSITGGNTVNLNSTLDGVTSRGNTTSNNITTGFHQISANGVTLNLNSTNSNQLKIAFQDAGVVRSYIGAGASRLFTVEDASFTERFYVGLSGNTVVGGNLTVLSIPNNGTQTYIVGGDSSGAIQSVSLGSGLSLSGGVLDTSFNLANVAYTNVNNNFSTAQTINGNLTSTATIQGNIFKSDTNNNLLFGNSNYWTFRTANSGAYGIEIQDSGGVARGYLWGSGANFGLLYGGSWRIRMESTQTVITSKLVVQSIPNNATQTYIIGGDGSGNIQSVSIGTGLSLSGGVLSATGGGSGTIGGSGTTGTIPVFTGTSSIGDSNITISNGLVGIGTSSPSERLHLLNSSTGYVGLRLEGTGSYAGSDWITYASSDSPSSTTDFYGIYNNSATDGASIGYKLKVYKTGNVTINGNLDVNGNLEANKGTFFVETGNALDVTGNVLIQGGVVDTDFTITGGTTTEPALITFNKPFTSTSSAILFRQNDITKGSITYDGTSTSYNIISDYRLKENVVEMTNSLDRVDALKPSRFNFINDAEKTVDGFLAHEVQEVVPEAITGEKDAVDEEGNPIYQGIDQSKLVPLLVGAVRELKAKNDELEARLAKLEALI